MITSGFAIVSLGAAQDAQTGSLSVFEIVDEFGSAGFPLLVQRAVFTVRLKRDPATDPPQVDCVMRLMLDDEELGHGEIRADFRDKALANLMTRVDGVVITRPGVVSFRLLHGEREVARCDVRAYMIAQPPRISAAAGTE